jgi:hypothetical protein
LRKTKALLDVRDVNEHGFDATEIKNRKSAKPSMHHHQSESALIDESSMVIFSDQKILIGPLNLYDFYITANAMREIAGFDSLPPNEA